MADSTQEMARAYLRRDPGSGVLYEVLATHLEIFLARGIDDTYTEGLPGYVVRERGKFDALASVCGGGRVLAARGRPG